jgi:starch synthase (maltosyl-transferring)
MEAGTRRVIVEAVKPEIDAGRFAIKRTVGEEVVVEADLFADGHDALSGLLLYRREAEAAWSEVPLVPLVNDRWRASFRVTELGRYRYTVEGWVDHFKTWARDLAKRVGAGQDVTVDLLIGAALVEAAAARAGGPALAMLQSHAAVLRSGGAGAVEFALSSELAALMARHADRAVATRYARELAVTVDRERARFSTWYELFPRSCATAPPGPAAVAPIAGGAEPALQEVDAPTTARPRHGTFRDVEAWLPYVASMGFDVLYLPPIHPIGTAFRKGRNNSVLAQPDDPGSPWAIGAAEGGHKAIHPELGTLDDFRSLVERAKHHGIEVALDVAYQASPDHPYVGEHPEWFRRRPDGTIQYAENPPKKYQDIYPFDFESADWQSLWEELKSVVDFWVAQGVRIFRVDNPHTKPFSFWEWLIGAVKAEHPEVIFLAEAFTRPKVMYYLAKLGFTQSYTYFAWRNTRWELTEYFTELTQTDVREYFRPNLWPNTPDILTEALQHGGRETFITRLILAATLGASYGIYGPAFELGEHQAAEPGKEEYLDSEKYEIKQRELDRPDSLRPIIARVNRIRRENPALQSDRSLRFHAVDNPQIIAYSKTTPDLSSVILTVVNLDPHHTQSGWVDLPLEALGVDPQQSYQVHDLLGDGRYLWHGPRNYVELNPHVVPGHILRFRRRVRTEEDFEYFA